MSEIYTKNAAGKQLPSVIYWTRSLRNLYQAIAIDIKEKIVHECTLNALGKVVFNSAGKNGAALALQSLEQCLGNLDADPKQIIFP